MPPSKSPISQVNVSNELDKCMDLFKGWIEKGVIKVPGKHCVGVELLHRQLVAHGFLPTWHMETHPGGIQYRLVGLRFQGPATQFYCYEKCSPT